MPSTNDSVRITLGFTLFIARAIRRELDICTSRDHSPVTCIKVSATVGCLKDWPLTGIRVGVPKGKGGYLPSPLEHLVIPFSGEIKLAA